MLSLFMYWMKYYPASPEWIENENKYGVDTWKEMQNDIMKEYRKAHPQRDVIENAVRIR